AKSINGSEAKYSLSCIIPKSDTKTLKAIENAIEAAKELGREKRWGGKIPTGSGFRLPLRDGDIDRPDDSVYKNCMFVNANSKDAPQIVDRHVMPITDPLECGSGDYCFVTVNFYPYNSNGNKGIAAGLGNIQKVKDGERLSGRVSASADFEILDDDGDLTDLPDYLK
ncbi:MAG: DUF2815 family protein, partial [Synergistaceae bacterium]|nr:DUF2815 family protein [Synergistaceae bacterium]